MKIGDAVTLVVTSFAPARRSVDLAVPARRADRRGPADARRSRSSPRRSHPAAPRVEASGEEGRRRAGGCPRKRTEEGGRCRRVEPRTGGEQAPQPAQAGGPQGSRPRRRLPRDEEEGAGEEGARQAGDEEGGRAGRHRRRRRRRRTATKRAPRKRTAKAVARRLMRLVTWNVNSLKSARSG